MPKTQPKQYPKKQKKTPPKNQQPPSLFKNKYYWIILTLTILVFTVAFGYLNQVSAEREALLLGCDLSVIGFAFYISLIATASYDKRATFIFAGASIIGFSIWVAMVLALNATGLITRVVSSIGDSFFAVTTLIICLILGALVGDLIGKNRAAKALSLEKPRK